MLEYFHMDLSDTMSFGDGTNDIPMLRHTALSVCMGNANAEVEKASDYKTGTVDNGGIVSALRHYSVL
jgi:hydroxymethylpyrimidine pyrophosphatase-like HAD family hydrolase